MGMAEEWGLDENEKNRIMFALKAQIELAPEIAKKIDVQNALELHVATEGNSKDGYFYIIETKSSDTKTLIFKPSRETFGAWILKLLDNYHETILEIIDISGGFRVSR